jgi:hypothetical protein
MASVRSTTECAASVAAAINAQLFGHVLHSVSAILTCAKTSGGRLPYIQLGYVQLLLCPVWAEHSDGFSGVVEPDIVGVPKTLLKDRSVNQTVRTSGPQSMAC